MWCPGDTMTNYSYILFNQSPEQLRRAGARGGKAHGRNQRARRALAPTPPPCVWPPAVHQETATAAIDLLEARRILGMKVCIKRHQAREGIEWTRIE